MGVDLAGLEKNPTGIAVLSDKTLRTRVVHEDEEIINICEREKVKLIAIDAPLTLPHRRTLRTADKHLIELGFKVFPPLFSGMRSLTYRGISLSQTLRRRGFKVIEVHPRTSGMILFRESDRKEWIKSLVRNGWIVKKDMNKHEVDACIAAITALFYLRDRSIEIGRGKGKIIIPSTSFAQALR